MTIKLSGSILISGVHQPAGTILTLGADKEAELVNRAVAIYTSRAQSMGVGREEEVLYRNPITGQLERWDAVSGAYVAVGDVTSNATTGVDTITAPDGTEYPLSNQSITSMRLSATSTVGLVSGSVIPFDSVTVDDAGAYSGTPGKILIPAGTKRMRITGNASVVYNVANGGTYRQLKLFMYYNSSSMTLGTLGIRARSEAVVSGFAQAQDLLLDTGIFDVSDGLTYIPGPVGTNYLQLQILHDSVGTNGGVANSVFVLIYSSFNVEFYD